MAADFSAERSFFHRKLKRLQNWKQRNACFQHKQFISTSQTSLFFSFTNKQAKKLTVLLTPWSRILFENLRRPQLGTKFSYSLKLKKKIYLLDMLRFYGNL